MSRSSLTRLPQQLRVGARGLAMGSVCLVLLLTMRLESHVQGQPGYVVYLPAVSAPPCLSYSATAWLETPERVHAGSTFTTTIALRNDGCSILGKPIYAISLDPDIEEPPPYQNLVAIGRGSIDRHTFTLTAPVNASGAITLTGGTVFEVMYYPGGPFGHGNAGAPKATIHMEE